MVESDQTSDRVNSNQRRSLIALKRRLYYISVFLMAFLPEDLEKLNVLKIGGVQLYAIDMIYLLVLAALTATILRRNDIELSYEGKIYAFMLVWIIFAVFNGLVQYGYRALGESRYVLSLFAFAVPFQLIEKSGKPEAEQVVEIVWKTIIIAATAGVIMFFVEIINGGRFFISEVNRAELSDFEDFRGMRFLGSTQTFNILTLGSILILRFGTHKKVKSFDIVIIIALFIIALFTKNRAALFAITGGLLLLLILRARLKLFVLSIVWSIIVFSLLQLVAPGVTDAISNAILSGLNPAEDQSGIWRLAVNLSALEQGMSTPWFGQGYGSYFYFEVPLSRPIEEPPHNQFLLLFLKTGMVGAVLCLATVIVFFRKFLVVRDDLASNSEQNLIGSVLTMIIACQLIYGMAYGFIPFYGIYYAFGLLLFRSMKMTPQNESKQLHSESTTNE